MSLGDVDSPPEASGAPPGDPRRGAAFIAGLVTIVIAIAVIAAVPQLRHCVSLCLHGQFAALRSYIRSLDVGGFALLTGLMLGHAVVWYPSEIVTATAAYVYGFVPGLALVVVGWLVAALLSYALGRTVGRPLLRRILGRRFIRLERAVDRGGTPLLLSSRLIPIVPFALMGYAAGATRVSVWKFSWTTVVGYLPLTAAVAYLGASAETLSAGNPIVWVVVAVLIGALVAEWMISHRHRSGPDRAN